MVDFKGKETLSIDIKNLCYSIKDYHILRNINLSIVPGEILTIIGPNGAGKSTFVKLVAGDFQPSSGKILYDKLLLKNLSLEETANIRSVLSQNQNINFDFDVKEIVEMGWIGNNHNRGDYINSFRDTSKECFIEGLLNKKFKNLSGGEQKRVHLARTFLQLKSMNNSINNKYLILDEPLTHLDIYYEIKIMHLIKKIAKNGVGILIILHDLNIAQKFSNKIAIFSKGKLKYYDKTSKVLIPKNLKETYGLDMQVYKNPSYIKYF